jgi:phosphoribosylanthranilate isomerase
VTAETKICGINSVPAAQAATRAAFAGFNFFPRSPRSVTPAQARFLAGHLPARVRRVALVVDLDDSALDSMDFVLFQN